MARYMVPSDIFIVKNLPTNVNGKILKAALREQVTQVTSVTQVAPVTQVTEPILA